MTHLAVRALCRLIAVGMLAPFGLAMAAKPHEDLLAGPEQAGTALVIVHDWFGLSPFVDDARNRLAEQGYRVISPDLYGSPPATSHQQAWALMQALPQEQARKRIDEAIAAVSKPGRRLAIIGFSMGVPLAIDAAIRHADRIQATVVFYGDTRRDAADLARLGGPLLAVFGSLDGPAADLAATLSKAADQAGAAAEVYVYPGAHHAFAQPLFNGGTTYDPVAAEAAWRLAEDFLRRRLATPSPDSIQEQATATSGR